MDELADRHADWLIDQCSELFKRLGCDPRRDKILRGAKAIASVRGVDPYYFVNSLAPSDSSAGFIHAIGPEFVVSVNSIPPGRKSETLLVTTVSSAQNWAKESLAQIRGEQLRRAGKAAEHLVSDVTSLYAI